MGVLIVMTVPGDTAQFESFMAANPDVVVGLTEKAKAAGCTAHRFALGEGTVIVVDEWDTAEHCEAFLGAPDMQKVMADMGAQGPPQITVGAAKGFPGEF